MLGFTQAFSSFGGLLVTAVSYLITSVAADLPALPVGEGFQAHAAWRYTLITGLIPALPIMLMLPFLPESPVWRARKAAGTLQRPSFAAIFAPKLRRTTVVATALFACAYASAFGALQVAPSQVVPMLPEFSQVNRQFAGLTAESKNEATTPERKREVAAKLKARAPEFAENTKQMQHTGEEVQLTQETGGLVGRIVLAVLALYVVSRRALLRVFQLPGIVILPLVFVLAPRNDATFLMIGISLAGFVTTAQFSYWGNYLPQAFPVHLRGTAGSFAANVGGRMIGTSASFLTTMIVAPMVYAGNVAYAAATVGGAVFLIGFVLSYYLPEPDVEANDPA